MRKKGILTISVMCLMLLFFVIILSDNTGGKKLVKGEEDKTPIIDEVEISTLQGQKWAYNRGAHHRFLEIAPLYWQYGQKTGIKPEVMYSQSAKETGFGNYGGVVPPEYNNWAGIKIQEGGPCHEKESHENFESNEDGVRAHFNHMSAYVGLDPIGEPHGRYHTVMTTTWAGTIKYVEELNERWAPSETYGDSIVHSYLKDLLKTDLRVYGPDRYQTAIEISKKAYPRDNSAEAVIIARGDEYPDALAGVPLAHQKNAPLLLTPADKLHEKTKKEIERVLIEDDNDNNEDNDNNSNRNNDKEGKIYILGGTAAISEEVSTELNNLNNYEVKRIGGLNRYDTAALVAEEIIKEKIKSNEEEEEEEEGEGEVNLEDTFPVFLVSGENFPDAVSVSSAAALQEGFLLLTKPDQLSSETNEFLNNFENKIKDVYTIGGPAAISQQVYDQSGATSRIGGENRFETAVKVALEFFDEPVYHTMATSSNFPDALTGGVYAATREAPVLLTKPQTLPEPVTDYLKNKLELAVILSFGGENAISEEVISSIKDILP